MGEGHHVAFTLARRRRPLARVRSAPAARCPAAPGEPVDAAVRARGQPLERRGRAAAGAAQRAARRVARRRPIEVLGEPETSPPGSGGETRRADSSPAAGAVGDPRAGRAGDRCARPRAEAGIAGLLGDLVATRRAGARGVRPRAAPRARAAAAAVGGFALCSWAALEDDPGAGGAVRARRRASTRPRPAPSRCSNIRPARAGPIWRGATLSYALLNEYIEWDYALRAPLTALYRALRGRGRRAGRPARQRSGATGRSRGRRRSRAAWCGSSRSSASSASIAKGRP